VRAQGGGCGLVKNLALTAYIRIGTFSTPIAEIILRAMTPPVTPLLAASVAERQGGVLVHVNGVIIGVTGLDVAPALAQRLRERRRAQHLPFDMSVTLRDRALHVATDAGGICRPLIIVSRLATLVSVVQGAAAHQNTWDLLLREGIVEYVDKDEESTLTVAVRIEDALAPGGCQYTHAELDPALILGICGSLIVFPDHNQSPRNVYQSAMGKQAVSIFSTKFTRRMDAVSHVLCYPMRALVTTRVEEALGTSTVPSGECLMVAILCYSGFNQEDSVIMNRGAVDRGALRSTIQRAYKDEEKAVGADSERFCQPERAGECAGLRTGSYDKLGENGIVLPGTRVEHGDALIGKTIATADVAEANEARRIVKRDKSTMMRHNEPCVVDAVFTSRSREGHRSVKVRTRAMRIPQVGDKVSSRHGQKGVIGDLMDEEDMPFDPETGLKPDIIVNPHAVCLPA
jgi:DNA-directed RNA polymerase II subunit RPB2